MIQVSLLFCARLYPLLSHILGVSLLPSRRFNPLYAVPPLPPRRSPLVLRLFALALADGSGLPFSLYPPPAALESQTPQREARALPRHATDSTVPAKFANPHSPSKCAAAKARFHTAAAPPYFTAKQPSCITQEGCFAFGVSMGRNLILHGICARRMSTLRTPPPWRAPYGCRPLCEAPRRGS